MIFLREIYWKKFFPGSWPSKRRARTRGGVCSHKAGVKPRGGGKKYQNMNKKMKNELHRDFFSRQMTFQKMGMARGV